MANQSKTHRSENANRLLFNAVWTSDKDMFDLALERGADLHSRCEGGTICGSAAIGGDLHFMEHIIKRGADPNERNHCGGTALSTAVSRQNPELVRLLLSHGCHPRYEWKSLTTSLHESINNRLPDLASIVLGVCGPEDLAFRNFMGYTPLICSVVQGYGGLAEAMLRMGASVNLPSVGSRETPLHFAVEGSDLNIVNLLLRFGANPNVCDVWNCSPRQRAEERNDPEGESIKRLMIGRDNITT